MLDRLQYVKQRFDEISDLIIQPDVIADQKRYVQLNQEYKSIKALVEKREEYILVLANIDEANEIIADGSDADMVEMAKMQLDEAKERLNFRKEDLKTKKAELDEIIAETQKDEDGLVKSSEKAKAQIEDRLLVAYTRLRQNAKNGLAVVPVERDSCGGCFNQIPPQRQLDIEMKKKVIVCEHCGRILVPSIKED